MNDFQVLRQKLLEGFPSAKANWRPDRPDTYWFLDITLGDKDITVEWRPNQGFGIADLSEPDDHVYGQGPDEVCKDVKAALEYITELLTT